MSLLPVVDRLRRIFQGGEYLAVRSLFVLSTGRTGTQSLTHLLNLSSQVTAFHEPEPQLLEESQAAYPFSLTNPAAYQRPFLRGRRKPLIDAWRMPSIYAEMSNRMTYFAPTIAKSLPNACFLHLYRHPADVVRSGMRRGWYDHHKLDRYRITPASDDPAAAEWDRWDPFAKSCWYWAAVNDFAEQFSKTIPPKRFLAVRFEDLFSEDLSTAERIFAHLGVAVPSTEEIHSALQVRHNAQQKGHFPAATEFSNEHRESLLRIAGPTMHRLGYSLDSL